MKDTHKKTKVSKSFKAPTEKGLINHPDSKGAIYFQNKKPKPIEELKEEYENGNSRSRTI